jgi:hypothetical protein
MKKNKLDAIYKEIEALESKVPKLVVELILEAEKQLKGQVSFEQTQEYDDNNYYTNTVINSIDGVYFDSDYVMNDLDEEELKAELAKFSSEKKKVKDLLHLKDENEDEEDGQFYAVLNYCKNKKLTAEQFLTAFSMLDLIKHHRIPEDRINND